MTGGLIQLVSTGIMDTLLTNIPEITYFKTVYRRYSNFAIETFEESFKDVCNFGNITECHLGKYGDLLTDLVIKIELPSICDRILHNNVCIKEITECHCEKCDYNMTNKKPVFSWANSIGHVMIEYVELQIGSKIIDKQSGEWLEIWTELSQTYEKQYGYNEMIGKKEPQNFSYTSFPNAMSLLVPLHFWFCKNPGSALPIVGLFYEDIIIRIKWRDFHECYVSNIPTAKLKPINGFTANIYVDYIFLDINEREKFINEPQTYIINQIQYISNSFSKSVKHPMIDLNSFKHPIKEIIWMLQRNDISQYNYNDWFNYSVEKNKLSINNETFISGKLTINGYDRIKNMRSNFYRLAQPYKYHTKIPSNYIYLYSFSLHPEDLQPSGTCNFSLFTNINLQLEGVQMNTDYCVKVYGVNLNFMLINKGLCGIAEL